jgi:hypothetical protein
MGLLKCDMAGEAEAEVVSVEFEVVAENRAVMRSIVSRLNVTACTKGAAS